MMAAVLLMVAFCGRNVLADVRTNGADVVVSGTCEVAGLTLASGQRLAISAGAELRLASCTAVVAKEAADVTVVGPGAIVGGGIRLENVRRARIEGVRFEDADVAVDVSGASADVSVAGCRATFVAGAFLKVGDGASDVSLAHCSGQNVHRGLWVAGVRRGGQAIRNVSVDDLSLRGQTEYVLHVSYAAGVLTAAPKPTHVEGVALSNVTNEKSVYGLCINGSPADPVRGVRLSNVDLGAVRWRDAELSAVEDISYDGLPGLFGSMLCHDTKVLNYSFYDEVFKRVVLADRAADAAWVACDTPEKVKARQADLRAKAVAAMGGFPERCPLNARVTGRLEKDGYAIEKVLFESRPGFHVSGHLFLPTKEEFRAPYPALLVPCGHSSTDSKWGSGYQRMGVYGARAGFAVLVYDPIDQGERRQKRDGVKSWESVHEHNNVGVRAMLMGGSQAAIRLWDGIRALDYLETRPDVDRTRLGVLGMSGGGTLSANINAFDPRICAGAPAGFLSTMRDVYDNCGPQDAEQQFFGQLRIGFNHLGFVCLRAPSPTLMVVSHDDFFPLMGALATYERAKDVFRVAGNANAVALQEAAGPHHWYQSNQRASAAWMRRWLSGDRENGWTHEKGRELRFDDAGFAATPDNGGCAFDPLEERWAAPGGCVLNLSDERTIYDILRDDLTKAESVRSALTPETVRRVTGIRPIAELTAETCPASRRTYRAGGVTAERVVLQRPDDMVMIPVVTLVPDGGMKADPVVLVSDEKRRFRLAPKVRSFLEKGHPVVLADVRGFGETASSRHSFYGSPNADEEIAVLLYALGDSLVARRAEDILLVARHVGETLGRRPVLVAEGRAAIPAAHARYLEPEAFAGLKLSRAPLSWSALLKDDAAYYPFANCIHDALRTYDWTDLTK